MRKSIIFAASALLLAGCRTIKYVPVETVRTERVTEHDSIFIEVVKSDSVVITKQDDTVYVDRWHTQFKDRWRDRWRDSIRTDSVQVPYPVEKQLGRFQQFCLDWGKLTLGGSILAVVLIIVWLVRWLIRRQPLNQRTQ